MWHLYFYIYWVVIIFDDVSGICYIVVNLSLMVSSLSPGDGSS